MKNSRNLYNPAIAFWEIVVSWCCEKANSSIRGVKEDIGGNVPIVPIFAKIHLTLGGKNESLRLPMFFKPMFINAKSVNAEKYG